MFTLKIIKDIKRPPQELVEKFKNYCTPNIADNLNRFSCVSSEIKKINKKSLKMVGTAVTVKTRVADNLIVHKSLEIAQSGDVIVIDAEGDKDHAILGEIMVREAMQRNIAGIVVDGSIRDSGEIQKMDFPVFARGVTPRGPYKDGPGEINIAISCGGIVIRPGDIIVGDDDGIVVIPLEKAEDILIKTEMKSKNEQEIIAKINRGIRRDKSWTDKKLEQQGYTCIYSNKG